MVILGTICRRFEAVNEPKRTMFSRSPRQSSTVDCTAGSAIPDASQIGTSRSWAGATRTGVVSGRVRRVRFRLLHAADPPLRQGVLGRGDLEHRPVERLTVDEAIEHLDLVADPFVFFVHAETGRGNVVYLRYDGHYGLIEPAG